MYNRSVLDVLIDASRGFYFRGKGRLLERLGPQAGIKTCKVFGLTCTLDLVDTIQRQIYFGTFEPHETKLIRFYLRPGMTFVDVGANVGYFTALATKLVGRSGRVIAFEPSPYAFERLQQMVELNRLENVRPIQAGLSNQADRLKLYLGRGSRNHTPTMVPHENATAIEVPVETLDSIMENMGVDRIDFMKIDVEGHEPRVLEGARRLLREKRIRAILCEFNARWLNMAGSSEEKLLSLITGSGLVEVDHHSNNSALENRLFLLPQ